ncbi:helix-turn-helix domain-containing protein [Nocardioides sp. NPDC087217]|uniref:helix-turn-helix domain-containing protein n=1 Tax=Nocardioides sp. NPDC087217 TaxID=3364335 RepID=UPI00381ACDD7
MSAGGADLSGRQPHAVRSALSVLEEIARAGPGVTAQQISAALGIPRATTYRLVNLLVQDEYLVRLPDLSGFALGHRVAMLASNAAPNRERETGEILAGMRARIRAGVHLASFREGRMQLVDVDPDFPLTPASLADPSRIATEPGAAALGLLPAADVSEAYVVCDGQLGYGSLAAAVRDDAGVLVAGVALAVPAPRLEDAAGLFSLVRDDVDRLRAVLTRP